MSIQVLLVPAAESSPIKPLQCSNSDHKSFVSDIQHLINSEDSENVVPTLLVRSTATEAGMTAYAYPKAKEPNLRATRLAFGCGMWSLRFRGDVLLTRTTRDLEAIDQALETSDWRDISGPRWLLDAARNNYHDAEALQKLASVMKDAGSNSGSELASDDESEAAESVDNMFREHIPLKAPLCLNCRKVCTELCPGCSGVYFCSDECKVSG